MKRFVDGLNIFVLITLITLILLEGALRAYHLIHPSFIFFDNSRIFNFRGVPFSNVFGFELNSKGFLDIEYSEKKDSNVTRVIGLGDSFVFGMVPYEYNFLTLLDNKLSADTQVINMGISGTSVSDYLLLLETEGIQYHPDIVICNFFIGNDLVGEIPPKPEEFFFYALFKYLVNVVPEVYLGPVHDYSVYDDDQPGFTEEKFMKIELDRSGICNTKYKYHDKILTEVMAIINQMNTLCQSNGAELLVVLIPDEMQVNPELQKAIRDQNIIYDSAAFDFDVPNSLLTKLFDQHGIEYLDLLPEFRRVSKDTRLYKPRDTHWNIAGNALASELIYKNLSELSKY